MLSSWVYMHMLVSRAILKYQIVEYGTIHMLAATEYMHNCNLLAALTSNSKCTKCIIIIIGKIIIVQCTIIHRITGKFAGYYIW